MTPSIPDVDIERFRKTPNWQTVSRQKNKRILELENQLLQIQDYITFKTSSFPKSKAVDSEYALVLDRRELKVWLQGLEELSR